MFAYSENNPINEIDSNGNFAILAVACIVGVVAGTANAIGKMVDHHKEKGTIKTSDWVRYVSEGAQVSSSIMSLGMTAQSTVSFSYNSSKVQPAPAKVHGNSLNTTKPADGYALVPNNDPDTVLKYGETTMGLDRYSKVYLRNLVPGGARMRFLAHGTKYEMHYWQHNKILEYTKIHGKRPPFNKSDW